MQGLKIYFFNKSKVDLALPWYLLCVLQCASISIKTLGLTQCWLEQTNVEVVLHEVNAQPCRSALRVKCPLCSARENSPCQPELADTPVDLAWRSLFWLHSITGSSNCMVVVWQIPAAILNRWQIRQSTWWSALLKQGAEGMCSSSLALWKDTEDGFCKVQPSKIFPVCSLYFSILTKLIFKLCISILVWRL